MESLRACKCVELGALPDYFSHHKLQVQGKGILDLFHCRTRYSNLRNTMGQPLGFPLFLILFWYLRCQCNAIFHCCYSEPDLDFFSKIQLNHIPNLFCKKELALDWFRQKLGYSLELARTCMQVVEPVESRYLAPALSVSAWVSGILGFRIVHKS